MNPLAAPHVLPGSSSMCDSAPCADTRGATSPVVMVESGWDKSLQPLTRGATPGDASTGAVDYGVNSECLFLAFTPGTAAGEGWWICDLLSRFTVGDRDAVRSFRLVCVASNLREVRTRGFISDRSARA